MERSCGVRDTDGAPGLQGAVPGLDIDSSGAGAILATADPPEHTRQRRVVARRLSATAMQEMEPEFRSLVDGTLDDALGSGRIEWMSEVAEPLPMIMVARIIGVPDHAAPRLKRQGYASVEAISGFVTDGMGLGHVVLRVPDMVGASAFYTDVLGFRISDYWAERMIFLHCNPRHHSIAFGNFGDGARQLTHFMLEVRNLDDVGTTLDLCQERGVPIAATFGRHKYVPWGIAGGRDGSRNAVHILYEDGREEIVGKTARTLLKKGEVARLVTGTGGGWGDPHERPVEAVVEDVKDGYVTVEQAERDYGVVLDASTHEVKEVRR